MYCSKCGKEVTDNSDICPECGERQVVSAVENLSEKKKNTLFDFSLKKSGKEIFLLYIIMFLLTLCLMILIMPIFFSLYKVDPANTMSSFKLGQKIGMWTTPLFAFVYSMFFFIPKKLYKNVWAYVMLLVAMVLPNILGFIFVAFLGKFQSQD